MYNLLWKLTNRFNSALSEVSFYKEKEYRHFINTLDDRKIISNNNIKYTTNPIPLNLSRRNIEIVGPAIDRKLFINALNSGADVFLADLEDSAIITDDSAFTNLEDYTFNRLTHTVNNKIYEVKNSNTILMVRPRGLHLHYIRGENASPPLYDIVNFLSRCGHELLKQNKPIAIYLPKIETVYEAILWNKIISTCEYELGLPSNIVKVSILAETFPGILNLNEIVSIFKDRIVAINCGRWDYLFSYLKYYKDSTSNKKILPSKERLTMDLAPLVEYQKLIIDIAHRNEILAIGGMSSFLPIKQTKENAKSENDKAMQEIIKDKQAEIDLGFDGTWVAHPTLVPVVRSLHFKNNLLKQYKDHIFRFSNFEFNFDHPITKIDFDKNLKVFAQYLTAYFAGKAAVEINNKMEDLATMELTRMQLWSWYQQQKYTWFDKDLYEECCQYSHDYKVVDAMYNSISVESPADFFLLDDI
jgi:malate synthase